ncbi:dihydropteroate synthase [Rhodophyticola sp. CCM32]|uniref:dihydropteroate synthase n=1 Tax=Rhodophyticola sp. CCM32 TaxID=2916397 RepID=UPI00107F7FE7|nr:dihydropteroate synthase [Rhodophyticola sp. CCM32]QBY00928.1 dihydropteroate synthase [Rhodophyticola sp. CCM32]
MARYFRPIPLHDPAAVPGARVLADGWCRFTQVEVLSRDAVSRVVPVEAVPQDVLARLTAPRADICDVSLDAPRIMGILNLTPDSFSDGGRFNAPDAALRRVQEMLETGADMLDIGGESTRPGAVEVPAGEEIARTVPVIAALRAGGVTAPISIDTRKGVVAKAALAAGAGVVNDISGLHFDPGLAQVAADAGVPVILMHSEGVPETMQDDPRYDHVLLDVYDALEAAVTRAEAAGIPRHRIMVDPGIGFGKRDPHNLALLTRISLFHGLGCGVLLGVSRKGMIGRIADVDPPEARGAASAAVGLWALSQGIQMLRVHDIEVHRQMISLWSTASGAAPGAGL